MVLHDGVDGSDHNTSKANRSVDEDVGKCISVNRGKRRMAGAKDIWVHKECVHIRWRSGNFLESQLLALRVEEVGYTRNEGIIRLVVA